MYVSFVEFFVYRSTSVDLFTAAKETIKPQEVP